MGLRVSLRSSVLYTQPTYSSAAVPQGRPREEPTATEPHGAYVHSTVMGGRGRKAFKHVGVDEPRSTPGEPTVCPNRAVPGPSGPALGACSSKGLE
jgi:hypothetical protein